MNSPQDVNPFYELAEVLISQGRYEEAIDLIAQEALNPASSQVAKLHFLTGQKAQENEQPEAAAEYYVRALEIDPYYVEALHRLAELRTEQQHYDEALELFQRLVDLDPSGAVAHGNIGVVLFYLGRSDEALQHFDQALSLDPTIENVRANREAVLKAMEA
ncbi:MAG: tetratricopeptide repeat protein, partial [Gemmatimonadota bacterium]|nr:tetratricopeptide repeat protein [Gemmatimonadota bacterium]